MLHVLYKHKLLHAASLRPTTLTMSLDYCRENHNHRIQTLPKFDTNFVCVRHLALVAWLSLVRLGNFPPCPSFFRIWGGGQANAKGVATFFPEPDGARA